MLPPCQSNLRKHIDRANYVARLFCSAKRLMMCLDHPFDHGWNSYCRTQWDEAYFPSDVTQVLVDMNADTGETIDNDSDSNDDNCESDDSGYDNYINQ